MPSFTSRHTPELDLKSSSGYYLYCMRLSIFILLTAFFIVSCSDSETSVINPSDTPVASVKESSTVLAPDMSLSEVLTSGAPVISPDSNTYFAIGYQQVSANNQDPILMRFDNGSMTWAKTDYETSGDDGTGRGLIYDPSENMLFAIFTTTGTQGNSSEDYRRFTESGWLTSYGQGGGARVVVLVRIDPSNGNPISGTFVTAELSNGNTNTVTATGLSFTTKGILLDANSFFSPRKIDKRTFECQGSSPFNYSIEFNLDLSTALSASADNCS